MKIIVGGMTLNSQNYLESLYGDNQLINPDLFHAGIKPA